MIERLPPLPFPPSTNTYYRFVGPGRAVISKAGQAYRDVVTATLKLHRESKIPHEGPLTVRTILYRPDRRRRDIDNTKKSLYDSLKYAGVYLDDSQIEHIESRLLPFALGPDRGLVFVTVSPLEPYVLQPDA